MSTQKLLSKLDVEAFKAELQEISDKFNEVSVSSFKRHRCVDCGRPTSKFSAKRCKSCNMKLVGKQRQKQLRAMRKKRQEVIKHRS